MPFHLETKKGEIKINTVMPKLSQTRTNIFEIGPQEDFVHFQKPKLQNAPVSAKVIEDLEKLLNENKNVCYR